MSQRSTVKFMNKNVLMGQKRNMFRMKTLKKNQDLEDDFTLVDNDDNEENTTNTN